MAGYTRIVQYGDITQIYEYDNKIKQKEPSTKKAWQIVQKNQPNNGRVDKRKKTKREIEKEKYKEQKKSQGLYPRSRQSINRSKVSFYRLCHHNIINSTTVHFLTLTFAYDIDTKKAQTYLKRTMAKIAKTHSKLPIRYISVPEKTKKGRIHYHLLVFNLPPETSKKERITRNIQRSFHKGFIDIRFASYTTTGIAGYMAKYMAKSFTDNTNQNQRGYNCSRNIIKYSTAGSNSLLDQTTLDTIIIPNSDQIIDSQIKNYPVPYLGNCKLTTITHKL